MSKYDMLFGMLIRTESDNGADVSRKMGNGEISKKIGELIKEEYPNFMIYPIGMELVEEDKKIRITNKLRYDECLGEYEDEDEEYL